MKVTLTHKVRSKAMVCKCLPPGGRSLPLPASHFLPLCKNKNMDLVLLAMGLEVQPVFSLEKWMWKIEIII